MLVLWYGGEQHAGVERGTEFSIQTLTDQAGAVSVNDLLEGEYRMTVIVPGFEPVTQIVTVPASNSGLELGFTVVPIPGHNEGIDVHMSIASRPLPSPSSILGTFKTLKSIPAAEDADAIIYDAPSDRASSALNGDAPFFDRHRFERYTRLKHPIRRQALVWRICR